MVMRRVTEKDKERIAELYRQGLNGSQIAQILGFEKSTINDHINRMGLRKPEDKIPVYDTPEQIARCLHCEKAECTNCVGYGGK